MADQGKDTPVANTQKLGPRIQRIVLTPPFFRRVTVPLGLIPPMREAQALWYYYGLASNAWNKIGKVQIYEGEPDYAPDFERLFRSAAMLYNVDPIEMGKFWEYVDREIRRQNVGRVFTFRGKLMHLPAEIKYTNLPRRIMN